MLTPKKLCKSMPLTGSSTTNTNNDVLVFENGTVLGSVIVVTSENISSSSTSNNNNNNNNSNSTIIDEIPISNNSQCDSHHLINNSSCSISANSISVLSADESNCYDTIQTICGIDNCHHHHHRHSTSACGDNLNGSRILDQTLQSTDCNEMQNYHQTVELLNSSTCSRDSRQSKRSRHKQLLPLMKKALEHEPQQPLQSQQHELYASRYPPQYTAIYLEANSASGGGGGASTTATTTATVIGSTGINQIQQFDGGTGGGRIVPVVHHRNQIDTNTQRRRQGFVRQWFSRPSLPFVIGILALGGVACTLGGIVLGSTGLVEHSTQYLSAALLMIGIGVSLLVISGAIWRLSIPDQVETNCPCFRHLETTTCRNCNSPFCTNRIIPTTGYIYPEFQHRTPPPSYLTSVNECTVGLLLHHEVSNLQRNDTIRIATPPPAYRSSNSLSVFVPLHTHRNVHHSGDGGGRTAVEPVEMTAITGSTVDNPNLVNLKDDNPRQMALME